MKRREIPGNWRPWRLLLIAALVTMLAGCSEPRVYGSIGISSGHSTWGHHGWGGGIHTSISMGGRIL